jgi:hypothetical protein
LSHEGIHNQYRVSSSEDTVNGKLLANVFKPLIADTNGSSVMNVVYEAGRVKRKDSATKQGNFAAAIMNFSPIKRRILHNGR